MEARLKQVSIHAPPVGSDIRPLSLIGLAFSGASICGSGEFISMRGCNPLFHRDANRQIAFECDCVVARWLALGCEFRPQLRLHHGEELVSASVAGLLLVPEGKAAYRRHEAACGRAVGLKHVVERLLEELKIVLRETGGSGQRGVQEAMATVKAISNRELASDGPFAIGILLVGPRRSG